ncbi:MAG: carbohydrate ABC transporter permease [Chloroflexi bacterium]|nr:MAG: carbohydrate ABC transporter permease [Chloroflexota bacterium]
MATLARNQTVAVQRPRFSFRISRVIFLTLAVIVTIIALTPFVLTVSGSFKTKSEILDWPPTIIPQVFQWQNYVEVWNNSRFFPQWILNSVLLAGFHLLVYLGICSAAGYAFARLRFPGATVLFIAILGSIMVPGQVLWVPKFLIINQLGLVDSLPGIALPDLAEVFGVFFMTQFFKSLPKELEEAASIDGASTFRTFRQIILPNAYPALAALAILRGRARARSTDCAFCDVPTRARRSRAMPERPSRTRGRGLSARRRPARQDHRAR